MWVELFIHRFAFSILLAYFRCLGPQKSLINIINYFSVPQYHCCTSSYFPFLDKYVSSQFTYPFYFCQSYFSVSATLWVIRQHLVCHSFICHSVHIVNPLVCLSVSLFFYWMCFQLSAFYILLTVQPLTVFHLYVCFWFTSVPLVALHSVPSSEVRAVLSLVSDWGLSSGSYLALCTVM